MKHLDFIHHTPLDCSPSCREVFLRSLDRRLGVTEPGTDVHDRILELRHRFVNDMGWLRDIERHDDRDRYDDLGAGSLHFYTENNQGALEASMRLTPVHKLSDSLSVEMLQNCTEAREGLARHSGDLAAACEKGNVWDLTRMVHPLDGSVKPEAIMAGMVQMIGAGIRANEIHMPEQPPTWIFTTTIAMEQALQNLGIKHDVVASGVLSEGDVEESLFCVARPIDALHHVQENPDVYGFTLQHVSTGLQLQAASA
jgi:N-acyl-L-homoserine lactone synthetase